MKLCKRRKTSFEFKLINTCALILYLPRVVISFTKRLLLRKIIINMSNQIKVFIVFNTDLAIVTIQLKKV